MGEQEPKGSSVLGVRLDDDIRKAIEKRASVFRMPASTWVRMVVMKELGFNEPQPPKKTEG